MSPTAPPVSAANEFAPSQTRVLDAVRGWIQDGRYRPGEQLPTMRAVARSLAVDKGTVCRAMAVLQHHGLVRREGRRLHVAASQAAPARAGVLADTFLVITSATGAAGDRRISGWLARVIEGLFAAAQQHHRHAMLVHPRAAQPEALDRLLSGGPAGCIVLGTSQTPEQDHAMFAKVQAAGVPAVVFGEEVDAPGRDLVTGDHAEGARRLTHWLADRGCRRILRYWPYRVDRPARPAWLAHRDQGYERAVAELGLDLLPTLEHPRPNLEPLEGKAYFDTRVRHAVGFLVEHLTGPGRVDAIMAATDRVTYELAAACRVLGLSPNRDVILAGYDADWEQCSEQQFEPVGPAVTVEQDDAELGHRLVEAVIRRAADPAAPPHVEFVTPLIVEVSELSTSTP